MACIERCGRAAASRAVVSGSEPGSETVASSADLSTSRNLLTRRGRRAQSPPAGDVALVLLERAGEHVAPARRRRNRAPRSSPAGSPRSGSRGRAIDRPRRQAADAIGVVRIVAVEIGAAQRPVQRPRAVAHGVDHRRIGLQFMPAASRLRKTAAMRGRSSGRAVSRSTMLARAPGLRGVASGNSARSAQASASARSIAARARASSARARRPIGRRRFPAERSPRRRRLPRSAPRRALAAPRSASRSALRDDEEVLHRPGGAQDRQTPAQARVGRKREFGGVQGALPARRPGGDRKRGVLDHAGLREPVRDDRSPPRGTTTPRACGSGPGA